MRLPPRETGHGATAVMAAMAARQVVVRSERTVVCRIWSLMQIRRKRVGGAQCGGDGEGGRAGVGSDEGEGGDGDDGCDGGRAASAARGANQQAASAMGEGPGGGKSRGERSWMKLVSPVPKRADAQREMRRQNGQRETKFLFSSGRDDFS